MRFYISRTELLFLISIALISFAIYANSLQNGFVFDDTTVVVKNEYSHGFDIIKIFSINWLYPSTERYYRPVTTLTNSLSYFLAGNTLNPFVYHAFNVVLTVINSLLVYVIIKLISKNAKLSFLAAMIFAVHPIHTEAVLFISARSDLLYTFFGFLVLLFHIKKYSIGSLKPKFAYPLSLLFFLFALLSKEAAITFIGVIILYDLIFKFNLKKGFWKIFKTDFLNEFSKTYFGYFLALGISLALSFYAFSNLAGISQKSLLDNPLLYVSFPERMLTIVKITGLYLKQLILPTVLSIDYSYNQIPMISSIYDIQFLASLSAIILLAIATLWSFKRHKLVFFSLTFMIITFLPASNIRAIGTIMADRLLYLPTFGFAILVALAFQKIYSFYSSKFVRAVAIVMIASLITFYAVRTIERNYDYKDDLTLWKKTVETSPNSAKAHLNFGTHLGRAGLEDEAEREYNKALEIYPDFSVAYYNLALLHRDKNQTLALEYLIRGLESDPIPRTVVVDLDVLESMLKQ